MAERCLTFLTLLLFLTPSTSSSGSLSAQSLETTSPQIVEPSKADTLLEASYKLIITGKMSGADRIRSLNDLVIAAPDIAPTKNVKEWGNRLIDLANDPSTDVPAPDRIAFIKNAVVAISKVDSNAGMALFFQWEPKRGDGEQQTSEDVWAFGARVIFLKYVEDHRAAFEMIRKASESLSQDGTYPFHAISLVIGELAGKGENRSEEINKLFDSAIDHYRCPPKAENQDLEFFALLQSANQVVSMPRLKKGVGIFADHLTNSSCGIAPIHVIYAALAVTSQGTVRITDSRKALLLRSFSFINDIDPALGAELRKSQDELALADATINQIWSTHYLPNASAAQQKAAEHIGLQKALIQGIGRVRESDPDAALEMTNYIDGKASKVAEIAAILPSLAQKDLQRSKEIYTTQLNDLDSLEEGPEKTRATLWMAEAAYNADDLDNFRYFAAKTFANNIEALEGSYASGDPQTPVDQRPGYWELTEFARFASARGITWPLDEAQNLSDFDALKARLLIYAAKGLNHR